MTAGIKGGRPSQTIDDIFMDKAKGKEEMLKEFLLKIAVRLLVALIVISITGLIPVILVIISNDFSTHF